MNQFSLVESTLRARTITNSLERESLAYRKTILLVEDEAFVREVTAETLRSAGYQVLVAENSPEALRIYHEYISAIDLLLTDIVLPGETGRELAARLREANQSLRILYVTGYAEHLPLLRTPCEDCLTKPFSGDALLERVKQLLAWGSPPAIREDEVMHACAGA